MSESKKNKKKERTVLQKIVNVFLYTGIVILILFLIFFAVSQTSTFRNYLKDYVVNSVNKSLNGQLTIGKLEGTIFTTITLRNTLVRQGEDTLLYAEKIDLKTSPLKILFKKIFVRNADIINAKINLLKDDGEKLNLSTLVKSSPSDTTTENKSSKFPYQIILSDFSLKNLKFSLQNYRYKYSNASYDSLNFQDLRVKDINLTMNGSVNLADNIFKANVKKLSFSPNLNVFNLRNISGDFLLSENEISAENMHFTTNNTDISINAKLTDFNLFDTTGNSQLKNGNTTASIKGAVDLNDLGNFVPFFKNSVNEVDIDTKLSGKMSVLTIHNLKLQFLNTHLETKGKIYNLDKPEQLDLDVSFYNSHINEPDVVKLLPAVSMPDYEKLGTVQLDTLNFKGKPLNFYTKIFFSTPSGNVSVNGNLDLSKPLFKYNLNFATYDFNLIPIIGFYSRITSKGKLKGMGSDPQDLKANLTFRGDGSTVSSTRLDSLYLTVNAEKKNILYHINMISDTSTAKLSGVFDFNDEVNPGYDIEGKIKNLDYAKVFNDSLNSGLLNIYLIGTGQNLDPDKMNLYMSLTVSNSEMNGVNIDSSQATINIMSLENEKKSINITSDFADITMNGNFSLPKTISLISGESDLITNSVQHKIDKIFKPDTSKNLVKTFNNVLVDTLTGRFKNVDQNNKVNFKVKLKDFDLISIFLKNDQLEINGEINGEIYNQDSNIYTNVNTKLDYIKFLGPQNVFFLSKLDLGINIENDFFAKSLNDINAKLNLKTKRVFTGSDIRNFNLDFSLLNNRANVNFSGQLEDYLTAKLNGNIDITKSRAVIDLDTLGIIYNKFNLFNQGNIRATYSANSIDLQNFTMVKDSTRLEIKGNLLKSGNQNLVISLEKLSGLELSTNFFQTNSAGSPGGDINLNANITGDYLNPILVMDLDADNVTFKNKKLGFLRSTWNYKNQNLQLDLRFLDSLDEKVSPPLNISGYIPMNLAIIGSKQGLIEEKNMSIKFRADKFNMTLLGDMLPSVRRVRGLMDADLSIKGTPFNPIPDGSIKIANGEFIAEANNLDYYTGLKLNVKGNALSLDSLIVRNSKGTRNGGTISGSGTATLKNFDITSSQIYLNGQLKILSDASKAVSPSIYGDLVVATNGKLEFKIDADGIYLKAPINVVAANLTVPQAQRGYKGAQTNFIYRYVQDTTQQSNKEINFENLIALSQQRSSSKRLLPSKKNKFEYSINVNIQNEAKIIFILDREFNQVLTTYLKGNFNYQQMGGRPTATGELKLEDGSTLEFLTKTFQADGSLRFESELSNPYLDIVGTYTNYYTPPSADSSKVNEVEVAVKVKLQGPLKDLGTNFIKSKNNLAVYYGSENIDNDVPDNSKDASDAVMFILTGQFLAPQGGISGGSQNSAFSGTASSIAGSLLGGFLNSYAGDYIRRVELRRVGSYTKFNLSGRVNNFRYSIGGTTDVFSDLSRANLKIEYPFFQKLFLRLERKEAITETNNTSEMINELGLKYKFEF